MDIENMLKEIEFVYYEVDDFAEKLIDLKEDSGYWNSADLAWSELADFAKLPDIFDYANGIIDFNVWDKDAYVTCLDGKWVAIKKDDDGDSVVYFFSDEASEAVAEVAADMEWEEVEINKIN